MFSIRRLIPILFLVLAGLACNTLFPELPAIPDNPIPDPVRKEGECTDPRFKQAELAAYQAMLQARTAATDAFEQEITQIEEAYKAALLKKRADYNKELSQCKDAACTQNAKTDYDTYVAREQVSQEAQIQIAEDREQTAIEQAQDDYNQAVEKARQQYCSRSYKATGGIGEAQLSGAICSLAQPFTITVTTSFVTYPIEFAPSSPAGGTYAFHWTKDVINATGSGSYTVSGADTDSPSLSLSGSSTGTIPVGSITEGGAVVIQLVPLDTNECAQP